MIESPEAPAEVLRRAATLMRECAEAATQGPWRAVAGTWQGESFAAVVAPEGDPSDAETWLMATGRGSICQEADARHAAFWHPGVALAVAGWLEDRAGDAASAIAAPGGKWDTGWCDDPPGIATALHIARIYLGETPESPS